MLVVGRNSEVPLSQELVFCYSKCRRMSITDYNMGGKYKRQAFKHKLLALTLVTGCLCALPICIAFWLHHIRWPSLKPLIQGLLLLKMLFKKIQTKKTNKLGHLKTPLTTGREVLYQILVFVVLEQDP